MSGSGTATELRGLLRVNDIIGNPKKGIPALIPVSRSTWWSGVKSGRFPKPVNVLGGSITTWRAEDIRRLVEAA
jgi:prophage regulatory protein